MRLVRTFLVLAIALPSAGCLSAGGLGGSGGDSERGVAALGGGLIGQVAEASSGMPDDARTQALEAEYQALQFAPGGAAGRLAVGWLQGRGRADPGLSRRLAGLPRLLAYGRGRAAPVQGNGDRLPDAGRVLETRRLSVGGRMFPDDVSGQRPERLLGETGGAPRGRCDAGQPPRAALGSRVPAAAGERRRSSSAGGFPAGRGSIVEWHDLLVHRSRHDGRGDTCGAVAAVPPDLGERRDAGGTRRRGLCLAAPGARGRHRARRYRADGGRDRPRRDRPQAPEGGGKGRGDERP